MIRRRVMPILYCTATVTFLFACGSGLLGPSDIDDPSDYSLSPAAGAYGTLLTLRGPGISAGTTVTIGGVACSSIVIVSATELTCRVGRQLPRIADVVIAGGPSVTLSAAFRYRSFLYAASDTLIRVYEVAADGSFAVVPGADKTISAAPTDFFLDPSGRFLITYKSAAAINVYRTDGATGLLELADTETGPASGASLVAAPSGNFLYLSLTVGAESVMVFGIGADGSITSLPNQGGPTPSAGLAISADGKSLYVGATVGVKTIVAYGVAGGSLSNETTQNDVFSGMQVKIHDSGEFVLAFDHLSLDFACYVRAANGALSVGVLTGGIGDASSVLRLSPTRRLLYVTLTSGGGGGLTLFIDSACAISAVLGGGFTLGAAPKDLVFNLDGSFMYTAVGSVGAALIQSVPVDAQGIPGSTSAGTDFDSAARVAIQ